MANNVVTVSGMFGNGKTYFADSPVVIDIDGLEWPSNPSSPFNIVRVEVWYDGKMVGDFRSDTGGQTSISFDISSALRAIWSGYNFNAEGAEVSKANDAVQSSVDIGYTATRAMREYFLRIYTEYLSDDGVFTTTQCEDEDGHTDIPGGQCLIGGLTEWERSTIGDKSNADVSHWEHTGVRNGDASSKPISSPERVGRDSIISWVDVQNGYTKTIFYPASMFSDIDDIEGRIQGWGGHPPLVLRDSIPYVDFLFVNRRGAVETCSAQMLEAMDINVETTQYAHVERPTFKPSRSLMAIAKGGRRSWAMSSGYQVREWAEWWTMEFLMSRQWWMRYPVGKANGTFVPVIVEPAKKPTPIYDRSKQQMPSVEFTVTLALEG